MPHCCSGKTTRIKYCEIVFVALFIQHAMHMRHIVICGLHGYTVFFHSIHKRHVFRKLQKVKCVF
jgi:hypothetical protein